MKRSPDLQGGRGGTFPKTRPILQRRDQKCLTDCVSTIGLVFPVSLIEGVSVRVLNPGCCVLMRMRGREVMLNHLAFRPRVLAIGVIAVCVPWLALPSLWAAAYSWKVPSGDWSIASNWGGTLPGPADDAYVVNDGTVSITAAGESCANLYLGANGGLLTRASTGTVQMSGGNLSANYTEIIGPSNEIGSSSGDFAQSGEQTPQRRFSLSAFPVPAPTISAMAYFQLHTKASLGTRNSSRPVE